MGGGGKGERGGGEEGKFSVSIEEECLPIKSGSYYTQINKKWVGRNAEHAVHYLATDVRNGCDSNPLTSH